MIPIEDEIDLHGMTVDEAIPRVDKFLDAAYRAGLYRVWVIHGKGTGVLRREIKHHLRQHPLVNSCRSAESNSGGMGATQVELRDW